MNPWDASLIAAADQAQAAYRTFAQLSRIMYDAYRAEGFTHDDTMQIVLLWNETFAEQICTT